jgi:hypothetical protein
MMLPVVANSVSRLLPDIRRQAFFSIVMIRLIPVIVCSISGRNHDDIKLHLAMKSIL